MPYVSLLRQLGCQSVKFNLRAQHKHGEMHAQRHLDTGKVVITKVNLHREASAHDMAHEVGHVIDYLIQTAEGSGGSRDSNFLGHTESLRKIADYTCAHHEGSSPDAVRRLKNRPASKDRHRAVHKLERYYDGYVYQPEELFARLVAVSFTEPDKAKAIAPAAYAWLQEALVEHPRIRTALADVGLWPVS
ncbi:MAG: hypothetical protein ETSY1_46355 (plasmid) [Candidatus Entotheonella factor]|uniref:Uncharacterized protein n=1 Tax=Entotheonella factor TaxID=1429438 RepID=W4M053_ENTF1|nr:MAG: hypothetical protein ETSY1_46355 [Candidatus Entotheonella factor]